MAGDWIKMRPSLLTSPKVNGIARILESERSVGKILSTGFNGPMSEIVTRNVMRNVTVASLLIVWGSANEHTTDGIFQNADLSDIDDMVGIPGFGLAMQQVGWAEYDEEKYCVTLPNFNEYNTCGKERDKESNAERQRRYRERKRQEHNEESNVTHNVTDNVTRNGREEKRRIKESKKKFSPPSVQEVADYCKERSNGIDPQSFVDHYAANGWKRGKTPIKDWQACVRTWEGNRRQSGEGQPDSQGLEI